MMIKMELEHKMSNSSSLCKFQSSSTKDMYHQTSWKPIPQQKKPNFLHSHNARPNNSRTNNQSYQHITSPRKTAISSNNRPKDSQTNNHAHKYFPNSQGSNLFRARASTRNN